MKKLRTTKLFLNKVKISRIKNASFLFGGTAANPDPLMHDQPNDGDGHTERIDCTISMSVAEHCTDCSLGAGEVTDG